MQKRIKILGIPVDKVNFGQALDVFHVMMNTDGCDIIVTPNSEIIESATKDPELAKVIESASLVVPDGIGVVYASRIIGEPLEERVPGIELLDQIFNSLNQSKGSVFFFGGKPGIAKKAAEKTLEKYPNIKIVGTRDGYYKPEEESGIIESINNSGAEFLCVALGAPKQEKFMYKYKGTLCVKAAMGIGGSLDVISGEAKRAPKFYCDHGLEWLYRLIKQPSRFIRMLALPKFMIKVIIRGKRT